jgi:hypothetical protein
MKREGLRKRLRGLFRKLSGRAPPHPPGALEAARACAEAAVADSLSGRVPGVRAFSLGSLEAPPRFVALWVVTPGDSERDALRTDGALPERLKRLFVAHFPAEAAPCPFVAFESEETVRRDYQGDWWAVVK